MEIISSYFNINLCFQVIPTIQRYQIIHASKRALSLKFGVNCGMVRMLTNQMKVVPINFRHINRGCSFDLIGLHQHHSMVNIA